MKLGDKFSEGAGHVVYIDPENSNKLIKVPKKPEFTFREMASDVALCRERFGEWFPPTEIIQSSVHPYVIHQEKVPNAHHITPEHLKCQSIRSQVEAILSANRASMEQDGVGIDFMGLEGSTRAALYHAKKYRGKMLDYMIITPLLKFFLWLKSMKKNTPVLDNTLELWESGDCVPEIGNVILGPQGQKIYLVDTSLTHAKSSSLRERYRARFLKKWNSLFLRKFFNLKM